MHIATLASAMTLALMASTASAAQDPPTGDAQTKGNAPLKNTYSINDGPAKPGANSFTETQARMHIRHAGYARVSHLVKGSDGIWRGRAMRGGTVHNVGLDFKGNVAEGAPRN